MANINILDKSIFNKIAAGEVVEKPASVVKELVENSIDAKATFITVEISGGGIKKIRITDNGGGMNKENIEKAFLPHATSKVSKIEDLEKIGTLGFRGEALSSIASVAKITALSKTSNSETGTKILIEGGEIIELSKAASVNGTSITVEDLFYNMPARAKFLRRPKTEENEITNLISRLILANPKIAIKYIVEDKIVYQSTATNLKDAIYTVYGASATENIIPIKYTYQNILDIEGYIGLPSYTKPNRTYQTVVINGRYVNNSTISTAIYKAYQPFIMKSSFPFFVIHINLPLDKLDVNVHPNKLEVKFENNNLIYGAFYTPIINYLSDIGTNIKKLQSSKQDDSASNEATVVDTSKLKVIQTDEGRQFSNDNNSEITFTNISNEILSHNKTSDNIENVNNNEISRVEKGEDNKLDDENNKLRSSVNSFLNVGDLNFEVQNDNLASNLVNLAKNSENFNQTAMFAEDKVDLNSVKIVGVCFNTYIIVENNNSIYFIDQHAGHERLLYDKFKNSFEDNSLAIQQLLVPYVLNTNHLESDFINNNIDTFKNIGFEVETFGINSFKISSVPVLLKEISLHKFFNDILKDINNNLSLSKSDILNDYLERSACRSAVKANDVLSKGEIEVLLNMLSAENQVLLCPHGRPIIIEVELKEIEKWFKRIV